LDVSSNHALERLHVARNDLSSLDVSNNPLLFWLCLHGNPIEDEGSINAVSERRLKYFTYSRPGFLYAEGNSEEFSIAVKIKTDVMPFWYGVNPPKGHIGLHVFFNHEYHELNQAFGSVDIEVDDAPYSDYEWYIQEKHWYAGMGIYIQYHEFMFDMIPQASLAIQLTFTPAPPVPCDDCSNHPCTCPPIITPQPDFTNVEINHDNDKVFLINLDEDLQDLIGEGKVTFRWWRKVGDNEELLDVPASQPFVSLELDLYNDVVYRVEILINGDIGHELTQPFFYSPILPNPWYNFVLRWIVGILAILGALCITIVINRRKPKEEKQQLSIQ